LIVVDTTVLAYAVGLSHPLKDPSERLLEAVAVGVVHATTSVEVIQEFAHLRARRFPRAEAAGAARQFARLLSPLLSPDEDALERGLSIYERTPELGSFDAVLAATAIASDARALVSADAGFASIPDLRHVIPGTAEFDRLLR
jgi:predicted nucleic acid-binding protein